MTTTTAGRAVDAATVRLLNESYGSLVRAGNDSVRAAWRFGQCIDSFTDAYLVIELPQAMDRSMGTLHRYLRLYRAYQRVELAIAASEQLETYNIDLICALQDHLKPVEHGRPMAGRHYRLRCDQCHSTKVVREEIDADGNLVPGDAG